MGFVALDMGMVCYEKYEDEVVWFKIINFKEDICFGDCLIFIEECKVDFVFYFKVLNGEVDVNILSVFSGVWNVS